MAVSRLALRGEKKVKRARDLDETARKQLAVVGKRYDGRKLSAEARIDGDDADPDARLVDVRRFAVHEGREHRYDAWLYTVDNACVFEAGSDKLVAEAGGQNGWSAARGQKPALAKALAQAFADAGHDHWSDFDDEDGEDDEDDDA